ncbi:MAG: 50S ribosomal protein L18 [Verrucomicrobiales bacterium]|nr:50S ribosomal protein L18 [Verrucomicrobiales bacterium]
MSSKINRKVARAKVHRRIRKRITGSAERPRLAVHFSNQNVYAQIIDDEAGKTLVSASTKEKGSSLSGANAETASKVGKLIAERAQTAKISGVVFDRGGYFYHGKVKALADAAREAGLQF